MPLPEFGGLIIAGVDEAGRGALAGPVVAAAVILPSSCDMDGCRDSKQLTPRQRGKMEMVIKAKAAAWTTAQASAREIERLNVLQASLLAMCRALQALPTVPDLVLVDGNQFPPTDMPCYAIIGGDARVAVISAASILAKTARDRKMEHLHRDYPVYNFKAHKGYPTAEHLRKLKHNGCCAAHRRTYKPVKQQFLFGNKL